MRLQELILENYRGYNEQQSIPLDGRVLLFYGQNGRGKSSVFGALEMALFPGEKIGELRRDYGARAPLTNRFNPSPVGMIQLRVAGEETGPIVQEVRDQLEEMKPAALPLHRKIAGHRRRIFFTQELLRDLMLGSPTIRYRRLSEMLGCDAYDRLIRALRSWAEMRGPRIQLQDETLKRLDRVSGDISSFLRDRGMESVANGLLRRRFEPGTEEWFVGAVFSHWQTLDEDLDAFLKERLKIFHPTRALHLSEQTLVRLRDHLRRLSGKDYRPIGAILLDTPMPSRWSEMLLELLDRRAATGNRVSRLKAETAKARDSLRDSDTQPEMAVGLAKLEHQLREAELSHEAAEHAWVVAVDDYRRRTETLLASAEGGTYVLLRLDHLQKLARRLGEERTASVRKAKLLVRHRYSLLYGVRHLYDALIRLAHIELSRRTGLIRPLWTQYYGQITSYSHFQNVDIEVQQELVDEDAMTGVWSSPMPRQTVRFLVSDPDDKKRTDDGLPMQALLSEGQLNCAVVGLALALSEVKPPPLKVIALDDPFVSWDDVNMENFLAAVRGLVWKGWTVILSTCDSRVVASFRKNMETLGEDFPSITYTFRDWDKESGPRIAIDSVPPRRTRHLRELPPDLFVKELL